MAFEQLSQTAAYQNPYYTVYHEQYQLPDGKTGDYFAVRNLRSVFVIPQLADGRLVLIKQFRYLLQADSIEFPAGGIHPGENPAEAANRELQEETGYNGQLDATEAITTVITTVQELEEMIASDKISDGMTLASWQLFRSKHQL